MGNGTRVGFTGGGGGWGGVWGDEKLHLIKKFLHLSNKLLLCQSGDPNKLRVVILAPTGVVTVNINDTTIHSGLIILYNGKLFPLNDQNRAGNKYYEVEIVVIDEISMVSRKLMYQINKRLNVI